MDYRPRRMNAAVRDVAGLAFAAALTTGFASLAHWQYQRGLLKQDYLQQWSQALEAAPAALTLPAGAVRQPQRMAGELLPLDDHPWLLLDNQRRGDRLGLQVYRFMHLRHGQTRVLVDFGWLPWSDRRQLPTLPEAPGVLEVDGLLLPWPGQGIALGPAVAWDRQASSLLLSRLDPTWLQEHAGGPLVGGVFRLTDAPPAGLQRDRVALPNTLPAEKHFGYALQWAGLAVASVVTALVLIVRKRLRG